MHSACALTPALKVLSPAFYAIDRRKTPMMVSFFSIGLNFGLNWWFAFKLHWGIWGLGIATGCVATINFTILYFLMRRETAHLETRELFKTLGKLVLPSVLLVGVCYGAQITILSDWSSYALWLRAAMLLGTIGVAGAVFFGTAALLRVDEMSELIALVQRKLARRKAAPSPAE